MRGAKEVGCRGVIIAKLRNAASREPEPGETGAAVVEGNGAGNNHGHLGLDRCAELSEMELVPVLPPATCSVCAAADV